MQSSQAFPKQSILIVDDDETLREVIVSLFESKDFVVYQAANGQAALAFLDETTVDVILSDVRMPLMDGFEFLKVVRKTMPISPLFFIMTGFSHYTKDQFHKAGANGVIGKPLPIEELMSMILNLTSTA